MLGPVSDSKRRRLRRPPLSELLLQLGALLPSLGGGRYVSTRAGSHPCGRGAPCPRARGPRSTPSCQPLGPQLAEIHGVPRGRYDGLAHEVLVPAKPGGGVQARASCPGKASAPPTRSPQQSGFSLSGELSPASGARGPRGSPASSPSLPRNAEARM